MKKICLFLSLAVSCSMAAQENFTLLGTWNGAGEDYSDVWGYETGANAYAIIGSRTKISIVDITTPATASLKKQFQLGAISSWRDFKTYGNYLYCVHDNYSGSAEGLVIIDMSPLPEGDPVLVNKMTSGFARSHNIYIDEPNDLLYAVGTNTRSNGIIIYDLSTKPDTPSVVFNGSVAGGYIHDIYVKGNIAYASSGYDGLYIFDFSTPSSPTNIGSVNTGAYNHSGWIINSDRFLFAEEVPAGEPLGIIDISELEVDTTFRDPIDNDPSHNMRYHNPYVIFPYAFVSSYHDGVTVFNIDDSDDLYAKRVGYYDTNSASYGGYAGCWGVYPFFSTNIFRSGETVMAASDISNGLYILRFDFVAFPVDILVWNGEIMDRDESIKLNYRINSTTWQQKVEIQKMNGIGEFITIDSKFYHNLTDNIDFSIDKNPVFGENIYRLKITDETEIKYSELITINYKISQKSFQISPNPVSSNQELNINIPGIDINSEMNLIIYNSAGQLIKQQYLAPSFSNQVSAPNSSGSYFVEILEGNRQLYLQTLIVK